ncbi:MAG: Thiol-disulfide oxidoreductase ResA [Verrucomicrobia subdivision 3 bacterium]|nr:Thiol-disulfide oxidoreductase ResA [Limisphaerales bacterium]MCS1417642.1 Thiol-disulfide oxidoreductase ResA [Limisphaerales bacterium]
MKQQMKRFGWAAWVVLAAATFVLPAPAGELKKGTKAPAWTLKDLDGKDVKSTTYDGKIVVLNFWATWCPPCVKEIPDFIEIQKELKDKNVTFVGVSLDTSATPVKRYVKRTKVNYPIVMVGDTDVVKAYGNFAGIPHTYVIDEEGIIQLSQSGMISKQALMARLKPLL